MKLQSLNPSTKQLLGEVETSSLEEVKEKVHLAKSVFPEWKSLGVKKRIELLAFCLNQLKKRQTEFASLISQEMGMPISQSVHDVSGAIDFFSWYLEYGETSLQPEVVYQDDSIMHTVHYEPIGAVAVITPWNFPASNFVWMAVQNLIAGNTVVFKDSEEVPLCGKFIEEIIHAGNLPNGVFSEVYGDGKVGQLLLDQDIDMICFTGSSGTGKQLYTLAAKKFIKVFLELGGSAPGIVCEDANIDYVLDTIYANRFDNCGQICDGLKRLLVHESKFEEVKEKLIQKLNSVMIGDATDPSTDIGPLVSQKQLTMLTNQVNDALSQGADVLYKKEVPQGLEGFFYSPTLLTNVNQSMNIWHEEVFGPVLPIKTFKTLEEAINLANDTVYGLGGYVFTEDASTFKVIASQLSTGMVQMNNASYLQPITPFGGCKLSGIGREHGRFGFQEVTSIKVISKPKQIT